MTRSFTVPAPVRKAAKLGLQLRQKQPKGSRAGLTTKEAGRLGIGSGVARARDLIKGTVSLETIKRMDSYFKRHRGNYKLDTGKKPEEDRGYVAGLLWGGEAGRKWAASVLDTQRNPPTMKPLEIYVSQYTDWYPVFADIALDMAEEEGDPVDLDEVQAWFADITPGENFFEDYVEEIARDYVQSRTTDQLEEELFFGQYKDAERYLAFKYTEVLAELFPALWDYNLVYEMLGELQDEGYAVTEADIIAQEIKRGRDRYRAASNPPMGESMPHRAMKAPTRRRSLPRRNGRARRNAATRGGVVIAAKVNAGNDRSGNPRRGWIIYHAGPQDEFTTTLGFVDEGYAGRSALREQAPGAIELGAPTFAIPVREYQKLVRMGPPASSNPLTIEQHQNAQYRSRELARQAEEGLRRHKKRGAEFGRFTGPGARYDMELDERAYDSGYYQGATRAHAEASADKVWPPAGEELNERYWFETQSNPPGKWTRYTDQTGGSTSTIYGTSSGAGGTAYVSAYKPRLSSDSRRLAGDYERKNGQKVPKGTKYLALVSLDGGRTIDMSAHKTLAAAKKAANRALGMQNPGRKNKPSSSLLPLASSKKKWSGAAARKRLSRFCKLKDGTISESKMAQAFAYVPPKEDRQKVSAYKLPIADVVNGRLVAVPKGVKAASASLDGSRGGVSISSNAKAKARRKVNQYLAKIDRAEKKGKK